MLRCILLKYVCICITTNEANVILLFILTEDVSIRGETRLRLSHNEVNKSCWSIAYLTTATNYCVTHSL
jgi:hypothetical protein